MQNIPGFSPKSEGVLPKPHRDLFERIPLEPWENSLTKKPSLKTDLK